MGTLLLVGHGSRDPRSAAALRRLAARVADRVPTDRVELAFLELSSPLLEDVVAHLTGEVVVVPLLLGEAFHARFDLPGRLAAVAEDRDDVTFLRTDVLGPSSRLDDAVHARAAGLLAAGCDGIVLLGTGSSRRRANTEVDEAATRVGARLGATSMAAFVTRGRGLDDAVATLRAAGVRRPGIVPWFLAPGRLLDAGIHTAADLGITDVAMPLADDTHLDRLVLERACTARGLPAAA